MARRLAVHADSALLDHQEGSFCQRDTTARLVGQEPLIAFEELEAVFVETNGNDLVAGFLGKDSHAVDTTSYCRCNIIVGC